MNKIVYSFQTSTGTKGIKNVYSVQKKIRDKKKQNRWENTKYSR